MGVAFLLMITFVYCSYYYLFYGLLPRQFLPILLREPKCIGLFGETGLCGELASTHGFKRNTNELNKYNHCTLPNEI